MTSVRRATPEDAHAIAAVRAASWRATYPGVVPQPVLDELDVDASERWWRSAVTAAGVAVFVAERERRVVGFVNAGPSDDSPDVGQVYAIYVEPAAWDTGSGRALMDAALAYLKGRWTEAVLWVAEQNPRARRFYERYGWKLDGGAKVDEVAPGAFVSEVRYRLSGLERL